MQNEIEFTMSETTKPIKMRKQKEAVEFSIEGVETKEIVRVTKKSKKNKSKSRITNPNKVLSHELQFINSKKCYESRRVYFIEHFLVSTQELRVYEKVK